MHTFLWVLALLSAIAVFSAILGFFPLKRRIGTTIIPFALMFICALGCISLCLDPWTYERTFTLPWFLPIGSGLLALDPLSKLFLFPTFIIGCITALAGFITLRHTSATQHNHYAHWCFFTLLILGLALVCTARDAVFFLLSWELMSLAPFFLVEFDHHKTKVREASWIYLVAAHLGALFLLLTFALLWQQSNSTAFASFNLDATSNMGIAIFSLALIGFGAKAAIVPLHVWLPETYPAAPGHIGAMLSGAMINAGLYGIYRLTDFFTASTPPLWWGIVLLSLGCLNALAGIFKALSQSDLKRLLAYSSVENIGIMLMGLGLGLLGLNIEQTWMAFLGFSASLLHMLNHASYKSLLFLCAGEVLRSAHTTRIHKLGGLQKNMPLVGIAFAIGTASIACLPPFNGFNGEFLLMLGLANSIDMIEPYFQSPLFGIGILTALIALALVSGMALITYLKAYGLVFLGEARSETAQCAHETKAWELLPLGVLACTALTLAISAAYIMPYITAAIPYSTHTIHLLSAYTPQASDILGRIAIIGFGLFSLMLLFLALRHILLRTKKPTHFPTWGCGFQKGTARIQYSQASFSQPSNTVFSAFTGLRIQKTPPTGYFPSKAELHITETDRVRENILTPLFQGIVRLCNILKIIQHGRIHLYILYMLGTLGLLLFWGLCI